MKTNFSTKSISLCAIMCALGTVIMMLGGIIPVFTYVSPLLACICLIPVIDMYGKIPALATFVSTALLSLILSSDKEAAFFYIFFGYYPIIKDKMDSIKPKWIQILVKACLFIASEFIMYFLTCSILGMTDIIESFSTAMWINIVFALVMAITMLLFDLALGKIILLYKYRLKKKYFSQFFSTDKKH